MLITKRSMISGKTNTKDMPVTQQQLDQWQQGATIQEAMPHLSSDDREFILTGITQEEWEATLERDVKRDIAGDWDEDWDENWNWN